MEDLDDYIRRYLPKQSDIFDVELVEYPEIDAEQVYGPQFEIREEQTMPRVIPPERRERKPMAHDGGPGVKDHSIIKRLLRDMK